MATSVIIVSFNCAALLRQCLSSLATVGIAHDVILVDNASNDGTVRMVNSDFPHIRLIANGHNRGFAAANNQGIAIARGRHILLLNPDTVVLPNSIERLLAFMERTPDAGACGPRLLNPDGTLQPSCHPFPSLWVQTRDMLELWRIPAIRSRQPGGGHTTTQAVDWVTGACLLLRREAVEAVGPLDEDYWMFAEESDWSYRARRMGWRTYLVAEAEVIHHGGGSSGPVREEVVVELYRGILRFYEKHFSVWQRAALALVVCGLMFIKVVLLCPLSLGLPRRRFLRRAYWKIMWLGFRRQLRG